VERTQWKAVRLDEVEAVPWRGSELVWRPVRAALDSRVVGLSAYTASRPGQEIVEDHVETLDGRGHEEVYVVLRGRARFVLDGEEVDASAGMLIAVGPDVKRAAVAIDADTAVLALGGPPDFVPAESEWIDRARPHMKDDPRRARQLRSSRQLEVTVPARSPGFARESRSLPPSASSRLESRCSPTS
jgi:mannose-6-phosphate isomerase-like protein (cupin superfamily)